jgi:hypothetical protein
MKELSDGFDFTPFQKKFPILLERKAEPGTLTFSYREYIKKLVKEGRISTAVNYHCSYVSLKKFGAMFGSPLLQPLICIPMSNT